MASISAPELGDIGDEVDGEEFELLRFEAVELGEAFDFLPGDAGDLAFVGEEGAERLGDGGFVRHAAEVVDEGAGLRAELGVDDLLGFDADGAGEFEPERGVVPLAVASSSQRLSRMSWRMLALSVRVWMAERKRGKASFEVVVLAGVLLHLVHGEGALRPFDVEGVLEHRLRLEARP
ncbi:hypothetical protein O0235_10895 [Tepidiforma flava]|uniref:Uncharacterized protein n=1 Tax=Tepidiforma flava TaxID=3004094 RepID=A0ABY7M3Z3_9CHLR|nr:hypothetical protein [Tepidiforma flava]WBL35285.1 hypothetical protein O0235_10895 [Tepidiforma flava]